ncbi:MAG: hypothetical protein LBC09_00005, partial [Helicobacteraceae bacterium]|nr:hypothetical protein [Helicobacteraceae bacterium]
MKKLAQAFIIVFAAAALIACSKTTIIYDQSLALERTTTITLPVAITGGSIEVTNYNGAAVSWESSFGGTEIKLPAGKTTLVFNAIERGASYVYSADNLSFTRDFAAG